MSRKSSLVDKNIQQEEKGSAKTVALSVKALSVIDDGPSGFRGFSPHVFQ